ncbi:FLJ37770-like protein [Trichonephila clavipes]|nr:FLJ37770-like protein [Trichonephila clavipes]
MKKVYGDCCLSRSNVFLDGRDAVEDDQRSGRLNSSRTPEITEKVHNFGANDPCVSLRMMIDSFNINKETIRTILHEHLGKTKVCTKFVLRTLSPAQKPLRSAHCKRHYFSHSKRSKLLDVHSYR